ncbi:hypothetical protein GCM10010978_07330 [Compostibacillus humi]|uniref:Spore coat protein X/V domain-containing protein n=1 Tax=Compostibacillus humi TaxID=1245525 RepID=A0A8J2ZQU7_9BACI|nr:spore coat protein [Compostibacillus humi]GGH71420.1 hypothetical protein GCM10010978_07330 [Compostibacillus humi]
MTIYRRMNTKDRNPNFFFNDDDHNEVDVAEDSRFRDNDFFSDDAISQEADQLSFMEQESAELIWVKESCNIRITSTDTQAAVSLQAALQVAIGLVLSISILDGDQREKISQELLQISDVEQTNRQKIFIYNTKDARVRTVDTDIAINIQLLFQILLTLVVLVDIL